MCGRTLQSRHKEGNIKKVSSHGRSVKVKLEGERSVGPVQTFKYH